jgi:tryptophanyl-tRNA synthetase
MVEAQLKSCRILTGVKPTGDLHLGNYVGAIKPLIKFSQVSQQETFFLCADWHSLAAKEITFSISDSVSSLIAAVIALGFDTKESNGIFIQSHYPQLLELYWYFARFINTGLLERAHAYKASVQENTPVSLSLFSYPVLMAADITLFGSNKVPVGKDQAQHLEYTSDILKSFHYGIGKEIFPMPEAIFQETPEILGTDGIHKMSKSRNNTLPLFAEPKKIEKIIKSLPTDSKTMEEPKDPLKTSIFLLLKSFASEDRVNDMSQKLQQGNYGYGHAKQDLFFAFEDMFGGEVRKRYLELKKYPEDLKILLQKYEQKGHEIANQKIQEIRESLDLNAFLF